MKQLKNRPQGQNYEAPQVEVMVIESQGVLCSSGDAATNGCAGTTNMNINTGYGW